MADYMSTPYLALTSAQQLWNQWEIQCLLVASFSLQVFLLFFSGIRKRHGSRVLGLLLWLAYLLADYVATFALGRLTLHLNDPRHQLVLFWTPFLLLHLGGQETIAAFSTEDSMLWKRHLLSLVSQLGHPSRVHRGKVMARPRRRQQQQAAGGAYGINVHRRDDQVRREDISSYWPHLPGTGRGPFGDGVFPGKSALFSVTRFANPLGKALWSGKMAQYNLIHGCIQEKKANLLMKCLRKIGFVSDVTRIQVSPELKDFVFNKLLGIATTRHVNDYWKWDFSTFRGQWLRWELEATEEGRSIDQKLLHIDEGHFAGNVLMWHITTEMCFYTDNKAGNPPPCRTMSRDLSNYIMYLIAKRGVKSGSNGYFELGKVRRDVRKALSLERFARGRLDQRSVVLYGYEGHGYFSARASAAAKELLKITCPAQRWELIATVWVEMLCYLAPNCDTGFHIKSLSTGAEFISQVRILLISLGIPFLREPWQAEAKDDTEYSDFIMF